MRLLKPEKNALLSAEPEKRFFIQTWYGMTHQASLDSHRVRCMNSFNVLKEFKELISKKFISNQDQDLDRVLNECVEIFRNDVVITKYYALAWGKLQKLIGVWNKEKTEKKDKKIQYSELSSYRLMMHYLDKLIADLAQNYKKQTFDELKNAILVSKSHDDIFELTGSLISKLLDEGFTLDNLYSMSRFILIDNNMVPKPTFEANLDFMGGLINSPPRPWQIIYRLEGFRDLSLIPESISEIEFKQNLEITSGTSSIKKFLTSGSKVLFAVATINSQEARAAGYETRKLLEDILDLLRFELEYEMVSISSEFYSVEKNKLFKLNDNIPNPITGIDAEYFKEFIKFVMTYLGADSNHRELKEKIRSTLRFYRMGRDSNRIENKFLNWWTALEHLVRSGGGQNKIYEHTEEQTIPIIVLNCIPKLLKSYRDSLTFCEVPPNGKTITSTGLSKYSTMSLKQFFDCLRDADEMIHIQSCLIEYPVLSYSIGRFSENISTPEKITFFLKNHETHLKWHLNRIWRARCDLVHSAETAISINLLSANLEFYLKTIFAHIANFLMVEPNISSMLEMYDLINHRHSEIMLALTDKNIDFLYQSLDSRSIGVG